MPKYLQKRRRVWYAVLDIPKAIRPAFEGRPRHVKSLKTESLTVAEQRVLPIVARWKAEFEAFRSGSSKPLQDLDAVAMEWRSVYAESSGELRDVYHDLLEEKAGDIGRKDPEAAEMFGKVVLGSSTRTDSFVEDWLSKEKNVPKTIHMKRTDVTRFSSYLRYTHLIDKRGVWRWAEHLRDNEHLKEKSIGRMISSCRGYWRYLQRIDVVSEDIDPFSQAVERRKKSKADVDAQRRAFSAQEIASLLSALENLRREDRQLAHAIWIGVWTGCRIEEICSLKASSVTSESITIEDAKSEAGRRTIPIHSRLNEGLSELVRTSTDGFVISGLTHNKYGNRSDALSKVSATARPYAARLDGCA